MRVALVAISVVYIFGFTAAFVLNTQLPVTPGLLLARSALWPVWVGGGLKGERMVTFGCKQTYINARGEDTGECN